MTELTRRGLLGLAASGAAASLLPPSVHRAIAAQAPRRDGLGAIGHIVVFMQENRAFDHYFGRLRGVRGFGDATAIELPDGEPVWSQPGPSGKRVLPFALRAGAEREGRPDSDIQYLDSLDHSWTGSSAAHAKGWCDGWIAAKGAATMTYYERRDIGMQYELADTFTVCDAYHCSIFGSTNPNRTYLWSGMVGTEPGSRKRAVDNDAYDKNHPGYTWTTYPERLEAAGVSWRIYQEWDNFTDNAVEYFRPFKKIGDTLLSAVDGNYRTTEEFYESLPGKSAAQREKLLGQLAAARAALPEAQRSLFDRAMYRSEPDTLVERIRADIRARTLPKVTWIVAPAVYAEHPGSSTPVGSANLIYQVLDAFAADQHTWDRTAILLNFDENDGYFDHVPPPVPPRPRSGNGPDYYNGKPIGLGLRVPMTIVSPWTVGGFVDSEVFDHTSVLRLLERWTGVREPNISAWRRTVCGDLTSAFDFTANARPRRPEQPGPIPEPIDRWTPKPPDEQAQPVQEQGKRPARPLPYQCSARAEVVEGKLRIELGNTGERTAPCLVFAYEGEAGQPIPVDVLGTVAVELPIPRERYRITVLGPNRFRFDAKGGADSIAAGLRIENAAPFAELRAGTDRTVRMTGTRYTAGTQTARIPAGSSRRIPVPVQDGWYEVRLSCPEDPEFGVWLTGHVENGRPSVSG